MGRTNKATKKFQQKHLKHTLDHRKEVKKHNKLVGPRKKKSTDPEDEPKKPKEVFDDMSVEQFFESGFEVPKEKKTKQKRRSEAVDESSSDEEGAEAFEKDIKGLAEKDPEFYKYLEQNDKGLLDFEAVNPLDAMSEDESGESEDEDAEEQKEDLEKDAEKLHKEELTIELVKKWKQDLAKPNPRTIKHICIAFKAAINVNDDSNDYKYTITDPNAFNELMLLALKKVPEAVQQLVKYKVNASGARSVPQKNEHLKIISGTLKSHAGSFITLLNDINNTETAALVLFSLQEVFPYYLSHRKLLKELLAAVANVWSSTSETDIQIATFAFLNNVCKEFPKSVLETVLKLTYTVFVKNCRKTNVYTMPLFNFCKNSAAELYGIDEALSYQVGFEYVRQLAIHLRNSINATSNAKEGFKSIYNWQFCNSLDFWSRVLSQHCNPEKELLNHKNKESPLRQLIYPLVQVTLGTIRLIPTAQFFPLRFYLIRSLIRLSQATGVFIPIFPLVTELLTSTTIAKSSKRASLPAFDFENNIRANQAYLGTRVYQEGVCEQFVELSYEFFVLYCKSIAFPELATPAIISLRRFIKKSKNVRFNKQLSQLVEKLNENATFITSKRSNVEFGPSNKTEVQMFLKDLDWEKTPLGQYVSVQRQAKQQKAQLLREAIEEEEKAKQKDDSEASDVVIDNIEDDESGSESD